MSKATLKTKDGQIMEIYWPEKIMTLNFPDSNTRMVNITEDEFTLVSIHAGDDEKENANTEAKIE